MESQEQQQDLPVEDQPVSEQAQSEPAPVEQAGDPTAVDESGSGNALHMVGGAASALPEPTALTTEVPPATGVVGGENPSEPPVVPESPAQVSQPEPVEGAEPAVSDPGSVPSSVPPQDPQEAPQEHPQPEPYQPPEPPAAV